jgi:hypothetical protein
VTNDIAKPVVTIVHSLPGRVRVRLSRCPGDASRLEAIVMGHAGMEKFTYAPVTRSVLVHFNVADIRQEEVVLRIALALSIDCGAPAVRILAEPGRKDMADSEIVSAALLATALAAQAIPGAKAAVSQLKWIAGFGTALAVVDHAWKEFSEQGDFHPEVLSLGYLLTAFMRGNVLKASVATWFMAFGRHLVDPPRRGVEVRPLEVNGRECAEPEYEIMVGPDRDLPDRARLVGALQAFLKYAVSGSAAQGQRHLLDELREVSRLHGEVFEGLGRASRGMQVRFN